MPTETYLSSDFLAKRNLSVLGTRGAEVSVDAVNAATKTCSELLGDKETDEFRE